MKNEISHIHHTPLDDDNNNTIGGLRKMYVYVVP